MKQHPNIPDRHLDLVCARAGSVFDPLAVAAISGGPAARYAGRSVLRR